MRIAENKGGGSSLGSRMVGEHRVQQGTAAQLAQQLARGDVHVEYSLVRALPGGSVKVQAFKIDLG